MQVIYFNNLAEITSDFDIEKKFQELKLLPEIKISNQILLTRFRLAVAQNEIKPFRVILTDLNNDIIESEIDNFFHLHEVLNSKIFSLQGNYSHKIITLKKLTNHKYLKNTKKTIIFSNKAIPVSDYDIEHFYQNNKNEEKIIISNEILLNRFRLGVAEKEIEPFYLIIKDKSISTELIDMNGDFSNIYSEFILNQDMYLVSSIWKILGKRGKESI